MSESRNALHEAARSMMEESDSLMDVLRAQKLRELQILDEPVDPTFEDITRIAAHVCDTPAAMLTFIDLDRAIHSAIRP
jgi:hypothetical protein